MIKRILILGLIVVFASCESNNHEEAKKDVKTNMDLSMYPEASEGFTRFIIELDPQQEEQSFQIEIYAGKVTEVDCNKYSLSGLFSKHNIEGWGYSYYKFKSNGELLGTMMACPDIKKESKFITSKSEFVRYNSKLPIVILVSKGIELKYKIWGRSKEEHSALKK